MRLSTMPALVDAADGDNVFLSDVLNGFSARSRAIEPRWFYDRRGSELFEAITELPEYYLTRSERTILAAHSADIAKVVGRDRALIEFGSGASTKTPLLLSAITPSLYVPIDISGEFLKESVETLGRAFPSLPILPITADFMHCVTLPARVRSKSLVGFFAGSTIGNMTPASAVDFLRTIAATLGEGSMFLIGIDRIKDPARLTAAYNDRQGVTAQFNLNLLRRINRELQGTIPEDAFRHLALWNDSDARMEMHLQATRDAYFEISGYPFFIAAGETIHTENSFKYGPRDARLLLRAGGWSPVAEWTDPDGLFALILAEA